MPIVNWIVEGVVAILAMATPAPDLRTHGCPDGFLARFDPGPRTEGPLRLSVVSCVGFASSNFGVSDAMMSPDGERLARWHHGSPAPIEFVELERPGRVSVFNRVSFRNLARGVGSISGTAPDALAWASDSRSLWSVRQETMNPSGWALSGLTPVRIGLDGEVRVLPALRHPAGPLDGIMWVGGDGLALAQFGSNGSYYRPEHEDPAPTLAMVDAAHGRILSTFRPDSIPEIRDQMRAHGLRVQGATANIGPDGRIRSVIQFGPWGERPSGIAPGQNFEPIRHSGVWLIWDQGRRPIAQTAPYPDDRFNSLALSPNGSKLLVMRELQPAGIQVGCRIPCPNSQPPPTPVAGPIAEFLDVLSGRVIWRIRARVDRFWAQRAPPAISPSGRYGLIEMPPEGGYLPVALVRIRDGQVIQKIAPIRFGSYAQNFGFSADGRRVWLACGNSVLIYSLVQR
jgi:hypothetical protein